MRWFHWLGLTDSRGSHPLWALPRLNLCPYYSRSGSACQGVFRNFFGIFVPQFLRASPAGLGRPTAPTLVGDCYPPCLGGGAQTLHLPTFRAIASCAGGHQIPSESSPFDGLILSHFSGFVKGFLKVFSSFQLALGYNSRGKDCAHPLWRPLARLSRATLGGAGVRIPS